MTQFVEPGYSDYYTIYYTPTPYNFGTEFVLFLLNKPETLNEEDKMSIKILLTVLAGLAFGLAITMSGCSDSNTDNPKGESISDAVIDDVVETTFAGAEPDSVDVAYAVDSNIGPVEVTLDASMDIPDGPH